MSVFNYDVIYRPGVKTRVLTHSREPFVLVFVAVLPPDINQLCKLHVNAFHPGINSKGKNFLLSIKKVKTVVFEGNKSTHVKPLCFVSVALSTSF